MTYRGTVLILCAAFMLVGCEAVKPKWESMTANLSRVLTVEAAEDVRLVASNYDAVPGWKEDTVHDVIPLMVQTCDVYLKRPASNPVGVSRIAGTYQDWQTPCLVLQNMVKADELINNPFMVRSYFEQWFKPYIVYGGTRSTGLFTGYYEAALKGSKTKSVQYSYPLYKRPPNLVTAQLGEFKDKMVGERIAGVVDEKGNLKPYYSREQIEQGALGNAGLELVWVDDPIDAFFVQIQGSGRVNMDDGSVMRIGFDGINGHEYKSIGAKLIEMGELKKEAVNMQSIRAWLEANPTKSKALLLENPSYVFFKELEGTQPMGSFGVELTPERSLAIDVKYIPLGVPLWVNITHPVHNNQKIQKLMVAQDTGGAIKGPIRGDFFWGYGESAEYMAGMMKSEGRYWILIPKTVSINP